jgi:hypothetical protein
MFKGISESLSGLAGLAGGLALWAFTTWMREQVALKKKKGDDLHQQRYGRDDRTKITYLHSGTCHCNRVRFRIRAPNQLTAVDIPSKIRFPRVSVPVDCFESLTDDSVMSHYAVRAGATIGIHTFCSYCGVHLVFSPSVDPVEVQVNLDCLDRTNIKSENVTYFSAAEMQPCAVASDEARGINRRGEGGSSTAMGMGMGGMGPSYEVESPQQPAVSSMVAMYGQEDSPSSSSRMSVGLNLGAFGGGWGGRLSSAEDHRRQSSSLPLSLDLLGNVTTQNENDEQGNNRGSFGSFGQGQRGSIGSGRQSGLHHPMSDSPLVTPAKSKLPFDSPMHRQLQRHLQQYIHPAVHPAGQ